MQFAVPQFTEVEDRLIGSLTLKQFLVLLAAGGVILFMWSILGPSIPFFVLALPVALFGIASALGRYNGRPAFTYVVPFAAFLSSSRVRVFKREPNIMMVSKSELQDHATPAITKVAAPTESTESRLKKLAYLLDSKEKEEEDIIGNDKDRVIQSPSKQQIDLSGFMKQTRNDIQSFAQTGMRPTRPASVAKSSPAARPASKSAANPPAKSKKFDPSSFLPN